MNAIAAVIVAAGRGERAGRSVEGPKQYRLIGGRPVLAWTLAPFITSDQIETIVVVIHPDDRDLCDGVMQFAPNPERIVVVTGAETRQASVLCGLEALEGLGMTHVMIHDGVRPFLTREFLDGLSNTLSAGAAALLPALPVTDTLKKSSDGKRVECTVSRSGIYGAQTPQCFEYNRILDAHRRAAENPQLEFTDDCSIAEWADIPVEIVEGLRDNAKLTTAQDIVMADARLSASQPAFALPDVRTGNGYDVHALTPGNGVMLCGIFIEHDQALSGHSDADVALHALTDALLATCGAGDIGDHFPPTDPKWKGASSHIFLEHAADIVRANGGLIRNADVSLICEAPRIGPHRQAMREKLAEILEIEIDRCSVKATTNEKLGFVGRAEGIAAIATATVVYSGNAS
ncbi:bifunctional 2-C-methyl-D-erythritol 4-phosphate cytidylyltransferase/2-C-methyl-D-erythritol 2,4-cyclodiphosphate synthase [Hoeflea sp. WL0058]|uniref:Bifunctional enzyme IspD/IspF n=1 Tax=Flavimaribacter sediminis TaxID=2865987 RepID=A0AAE2ZIQ2_9HYPH|nr:bifunctional 2-C-methyl-D-erythritol 4-phosphate cytidylyltransferase/2-C-methyl-D-erythritol 2,4-cyclodiphosphate synthase [Flavimaribacter sediminis]MBW8636941.1 bifunctional 2-C-methyl-D-erythritol 4-phosphate cytidylyltransferase/2-C-methyl-D-erythritol 2,4-cyclodiphosphate synthase [Flavimaribacter sediminis]